MKKNLLSVVVLLLSTSFFALGMNQRSANEEHGSLQQKEKCNEPGVKIKTFFPCEDHFDRDKLFALLKKKISERGPVLIKENFGIAVYRWADNSTSIVFGDTPTFEENFLHEKNSSEVVDFLSGIKDPVDIDFISKYFERRAYSSGKPSSMIKKKIKTILQSLKKVNSAVFWGMFFGHSRGRFFFCSGPLCEDERDGVNDLLTQKHKLVENETFFWISYADVFKREKLLRIKRKKLIEFVGNRLKKIPAQYRCCVSVYSEADMYQKCYEDRSECVDGVLRSSFHNYISEYAKRNPNDFPFGISAEEIDEPGEKKL